MPGGVVTVVDPTMGPPGRAAAENILGRSGIGCTVCQVRKRTAYARAIELCASCARIDTGMGVVDELGARGWMLITGELAKYLTQKVPIAPFLCVQWPGNVGWKVTNWAVTQQGPSVPTRAIQSSIAEKQTYFSPTYLRALLDVGTLVRRVKPALPRPLDWPRVLARAIDDEEFRAPIDTLVTLAVQGFVASLTNEAANGLLALINSPAGADQVGRAVRDFIAETNPELCSEPARKK